MNAPAASIEGHLDIVLGRGSDGRCVPSIRSTRPFDLPRTFIGHEPEAVAERVGHLFGLCRFAQKAAALGAIEGALGVSPSRDAMERRRLVLWAEAVRERALAAFGGSMQAQAAALRPVVQAAAALAAWGAPAFRLGAQTQEELPQNLADAAAIMAEAAAGLPHTVPAATLGVARLSASELDRAGLCPADATDSGLAAAPTIAGAPRWTAGEIAGAERFAGLAFERCGPGWGVAVMMTARGLLAHGVRLESGRIGAYRITAPTEWTFHPEGLAARRLAALKPSDDWISRGEAIVRDLDPCIGFTVREAEAGDA